MASKQFISQYDGLHVKVGETFQRVDKGGAIPDAADADHVQVLADRGMVAEGDVVAGFVDLQPNPPVDGDAKSSAKPGPAKSSS
jgi:hypothetical protein